MKKVKPAIFFMPLIICGCSSPKDIELSKEPIQVEFGESVEDSIQSAIDSPDKLPDDLKISIDGNVNPTSLPLGEYSVTIGGSGLTEKEATLIVQDTKAPEISLIKEDIPVNYSGGVDTLINVNDLDSDIKIESDWDDKKISSPGSIAFNVKATDSSGNETSQSYTVTVHDYETEKKAAAEAEQKRIEEEKKKQEEEERKKAEEEKKKYEGEFDGVTSSKLNETKDGTYGSYYELEIFMDDDYAYSAVGSPKKSIQELYDFYDKKYNLSQYSEQSDSKGTQPYISMMTGYYPNGMTAFIYWFGHTEDTGLSSHSITLFADEGQLTERIPYSVR